MFPLLNPFPLPEILISINKLGDILVDGSLLSQGAETKLSTPAHQSQSHLTTSFANLLQVWKADEKNY